LCVYLRNKEIGHNKEKILCTELLKNLFVANAYMYVYIYIYTVLMHKRHWPQKKKNIYMYMPINTVVSTVGLILPMLNKLINYFKSV
jgi:hypothetical protein